MKRKLIVLAALVSIFTIAILARFFIFDNPGATGRIKILSSPTAGVFINDVGVGKTPFEDRLKPGEYSIRLIPEGEGSESIAWEGKVSIYAHTLTYISREMGTSDLTSAGEILSVVKIDSKPKGETGEIELVTDPPGAIVFLNNEEKGVTPLILQDVPVGEHELAVYLPGFFRRTKKIQIDKKGYRVQASIKMALDKSHKTLEEELEKAAIEATKEADLNKEEEIETKTLMILDTPTGFLNVRAEPSVSGNKVSEVKPGEEYVYAEEDDGWYKILLENEENGWVHGDYVELN
ncbi:MAG: PEGA domain-containing protein [bacterium]|nr:PEGA domain-containing protein [bacterium]